jgi:hypothetical protein
VYACKNFFRVRNGDVASRQGVLGGSWTQLGWLVDTAAVQATVVHMGRQGQRHLALAAWAGGHGMGVTAARCWRPWPRLWLSTAGLAAVAAFVALNGRLGVDQLHSV